ncbi:hypothetical protein [Methylocystis heyeri]|uniref:Uncharacterized protein n=1 Tax=Methylocystis heyeri TaxID=391905 RepID=A0A6B8KI11_9HYPH|nr:hypothetical protein [Methylocystis heyeri]QGM46148.1 hypothetical protein H2LOC_010820 [Methylocystis heyeri]
MSFETYTKLKKAVFENLNSAKENGYTAATDTRQEAVNLMDCSADTPECVLDLIEALIKEWKAGEASDRLRG